jgi:hypothetical protein
MYTHLPDKNWITVCVCVCETENRRVSGGSDALCSMSIFDVLPSGGFRCAETRCSFIVVIRAPRPSKNRVKCHSVRKDRANCAFRKTEWGNACIAQWSRRIRSLLFDSEIVRLPESAVNVRNSFRLSLQLLMPTDVYRLTEEMSEKVFMLWPLLSRFNHN